VLHHHPATRPLVAEILSCEAWFSDGQPTWKGAPPSDQATRSRLAYIKRLRRFADQFPPAAALAATLEACQPHRRCLSGACPECARAFQRWFVRSTKRLISGSHSTGELVTASIVFPNGRAPTHLVNTLSTENMKRAVIHRGPRARCPASARRGSRAGVPRRHHDGLGLAKGGSTRPPDDRTAGGQPPA
jgi:hypothetical protein